MHRSHDLKAAGPNGNQILFKRFFHSKQEEKRGIQAVLLASAMLASVAAGCGSSGAGNGEAAVCVSPGTTESKQAAQTADAAALAAAEGETITFPLEKAKNFSMLCVINGDTPMDEVDAFKYLNEQSNITFDVNSVP